MENEITIRKKYYLISYKNNYDFAGDIYNIYVWLNIVIIFNKLKSSHATPSSCILDMVMLKKSLYCDILINFN